LPIVRRQLREVSRAIARKGRAKEAIRHGR